MTVDVIICIMAYEQPTPRFQSEARLGIERPTDPRYSLTGGVIVRDWLMPHPSGWLRVVAYPTPTGKIARYRDRLIRNGLILGRLQPSAEAGTEYVTIPRSARPLNYDASSPTEGAYTYNDKKLFSSLGSLLATVVTLDPRVNLRVQEPVEDKVAIVEFTHLSERALYLIPGTEYFLQPCRKGFDIQNYYMEQLEATFANRFTDAANDFKAGFAGDAAV